MVHRKQTVQPSNQLIYDQHIDITMHKEKIWYRNNTYTLIFLDIEQFINETITIHYIFVSCLHVREGLSGIQVEYTHLIFNEIK